MSWLETTFKMFVICSWFSGFTIRAELSWVILLLISPGVIHMAVAIKRSTGAAQPPRTHGNLIPLSAGWGWLSAGPGASAGMGHICSMWFLYMADSEQPSRKTRVEAARPLKNKALKLYNFHSMLGKNKSHSHTYSRVKIIDFTSCWKEQPRSMKLNLNYLQLILTLSTHLSP